MYFMRSIYSKKSWTMCMRKHQRILGCDIIIQENKIILNQLMIILYFLHYFDSEIEKIKFKGWSIGN